MQTPLSALPMELSWRVPPLSCRSDDSACLTVVTAGGTDLFCDPGGGEPALSAPRLLGSPPDGDFQLAARVTVGFAGTFDAGVLLVWVDERTWAKLCFERSPQGPAMVVSVVTRGVSDDANGFTVPGSGAADGRLWLRVSRHSPAWAFHASTDGRYWRLVRYFSLPEGAPVLVGFEAQSPMGGGCEVTFDQIRFTPHRLADLRDGS